MIQIHLDEVEEARTEGKDCATRNAAQRGRTKGIIILAEAAALLILLFCLIFGGNGNSKMEKLSKENLGYQQTVASLNEGRIEDGKKMQKLEADIKAAESKKQELESKLTLADKSTTDAIKEKVDTAKKLSEAETHAKQLESLADKAKNADLYSSQADSARKERDEAKGKLEASEAKVLELEKALVLRQQQPVPVAVAVPSIQAVTDAAERKQYPGSSIFSRQPEGLAVADNGNESQWRTAMRSFVQKGQNDLDAARAAGGASPQDIKAVENSIAAFQATLDGNLTDPQREYLTRFAANGKLKAQDRTDIQAALAAQAGAKRQSASSGSSRFNIRPN